jgi:hypothetical protein
MVDHARQLRIAVAERSIDSDERGEWDDLSSDNKEKE